jgi:hypothetical protein
MRDYMNIINRYKRLRDALYQAGYLDDNWDDGLI